MTRPQVSWGDSIILLLIHYIFLRLTKLPTVYSHGDSTFLAFMRSWLKAASRTRPCTGFRLRVQTNNPHAVFLEVGPADVQCSELDYLFQVQVPTSPMRRVSLSQWLSSHQSPRIGSPWFQFFWLSRVPSRTSPYGQGWGQGRTALSGNTTEAQGKGFPRPTDRHGREILSPQRKIFRKAS